MALLSIHLFGRFQVKLDGTVVTGFSTDKTRALLAFLATESDRLHRRQTLAGLLWPNYPERSARTSLRTALANLRQAIGDRQVDPPFLLTSRQSIGINQVSDIWADVTVLAGLLDLRHNPQIDIDQLEEAASLYQGEFLEGFSLADSASFDDWVLIKREQSRQQMIVALDRLTAGYREMGNHQKAIRYARRRLALDPWQESAHRELMRLLAATGRRADALAQYEACRQILAKELGVEPEAATTDIYQDIRDGRLGDGAVSPAWSYDIAPSLLRSVTKAAEVDQPAFVGRTRELQRLHTCLQNAMGGRGQVVFCVGGAGRGKTVLVEEFVQQATRKHAVVSATGYCNAYSGGGDPYLPFRQVLETLTGDVDDRWAAGQITKERATRLWHVLPETAKAIVDVGPDLIGTFLAGNALVERASAAASDMAWLSRLGRLVKARSTLPYRADLEQRTLIDQYVRVLEHVAQCLPLLIVLEDLHWADRGSIDLLLHLGRRLSKSRILIVGAYRPDEIATRSEEGPHPLEDAVNELRSLHGEITIDLALEDPATGRQFVNDLLDVEPNRLGDAFRRALYECTRGHPLFTVEMLRMLQEQGDLLKNENGRWVEGPVLAWDRVPARVEAVIQKRVGRLAPSLYEYLAVASVEGEDFTAGVISRVLKKPERQVLRALAQDLGQKHRLLQQHGDFGTTEHLVSRFRFSHHLVQRYIYDSLPAGERRLLHEDVAKAVEDLFADDIEPATIQLAYHYSHAQVKDKALHYLTQAGHQAYKRYDGEQAAHYYTQALSLAADSSPDRFYLLAARSAVYDRLARRGDQKADIDTMEALATSLGDRGLHCDALLALSDFYLATEMFRALEPAQQALDVAQELGDGVREAHALRRLAWEGRLGAGLQTSRIYLEKAADRFSEAGLPGEAAGCLFMLSRRLPVSGKHSFELDLAERAIALGRQSGDYHLQATAKKNLAVAYMDHERYDQALSLARESLNMQRDLGDRHEQCSTLDVMGVILARLGRREEALAAFQRCLTLSEEIGFGWGILGAVFGYWNYGYVRDGEYKELLAFLDGQLDYANANKRDWLVGFASWLRTQGVVHLGQYGKALALIQARGYPAVETDLVSHACMEILVGSIRGNLGCYDQARQNLEKALVLAEKTSDPYMIGWPLAALANLALCEGGHSTLRRGLEQAQMAASAAQAVHEERLWAEALDVSGRLHLALGSPEKAYDDSCQALRLLQSSPWLPKPQSHLYTHFLALCALDRPTEASEHLERAYERVQAVAGKLADEALCQSWLQNVRVNREILAHWNDIHSKEC